MFFFLDNDTSGDETELLQVLQGLMENWENEIVEFKEANNDYDRNKIGQYVSAISNEANLKGQQFGWLIFGVRNKDKRIVGSVYRDTAGLEKLKQEIAQNTTGGLSFTDIYEVYPSVDAAPKRVVMFKFLHLRLGFLQGGIIIITAEMGNRFQRFHLMSKIVSGGSIVKIGLKR